LNASFLKEDAFGEGAKGRTRGRVRSPEAARRKFMPKILSLISALPVWVRSLSMLSLAQALKNRKKNVVNRGVIAVAPHP